MIDDSERQCAAITASLTTCAPFDGVLPLTSADWCRAAFLVDKK